MNIRKSIVSIVYLLLVSILITGCACSTKLNATDIEGTYNGTDDYNQEWEVVISANGTIYLTEFKGAKEKHIQGEWIFDDAYPQCLIVSLTNADVKLKIDELYAVYDEGTKTIKFYTWSSTTEKGSLRKNSPEMEKIKKGFIDKPEYAEIVTKKQ